MVAETVYLLRWSWATAAICLWLWFWVGLLVALFLGRLMSINGDNNEY